MNKSKIVIHFFGILFTLILLLNIVITIYRVWTKQPVSTETPGLCVEQAPPGIDSSSVFVWDGNGIITKQNQDTLLYYFEPVSKDSIIVR